MSAWFDCDSLTMSDSSNDCPALDLQQAGTQRNISINWLLRYSYLQVINLIPTYQKFLTFHPTPPLPPFLLEHQKCYWTSLDNSHAGWVSPVNKAMMGQKGPFKKKKKEFGSSYASFNKPLLCLWTGWAERPWLCSVLLELSGIRPCKVPSFTLFCTWNHKSLSRTPGARGGGCCSKGSWTWIKLGRCQNL